MQGCKNGGLLESIKGDSKKELMIQTNIIQKLIK